MCEGRKPKKPLISSIYPQENTWISCIYPQENTWRWWPQRLNQQWQKTLAKKGWRPGLRCCRWGTTPEFWREWLHFYDSRCPCTQRWRTCHSLYRCSKCWHQRYRLLLRSTCLLGTDLGHSHKPITGRGYQEIQQNHHHNIYFQAPPNIIQSREGYQFLIHQYCQQLHGMTVCTWNDFDKTKPGEIIHVLFVTLEARNRKIQ